jgi:predicted benzoate:H+ symporter BenE
MAFGKAHTAPITQHIATPKILTPEFQVAHAVCLEWPPARQAALESSPDATA